MASQKGQIYAIDKSRLHTNAVKYGVLNSICAAKYAVVITNAVKNARKYINDAVSDGVLVCMKSSAFYPVHIAIWWRKKRRFGCTERASLKAFCL